MAQSSPVPSSSSRSSESKPAAAAAKKARSPVERIVVWGGIVVLLGLAAYQARARVGYTMTLSALQDRLEEDEGSDAKQLLLKDLDSYVVGWPSRTQEEPTTHKGTIELTWPGLSASYGIVVGYDPSEEGKPVTGLETRGYQEPPAEERKAPPHFSPEEAARAGANIPPGAPGGPPAQGTPEGSGVPQAEESAAAPAASETGATEPAAAEPAAAEPATAEPAAETPTTEPPATAEPAPPADTGK